MVEYKCMECEKSVELESLTQKIICPHCSGRIFLKARPGTMKTVQAR